MKYRIKELEDLIKHHKHLYYNELPQISDLEYDALEEELRSLDPDNEVFKIVGAPIADDSKWVKVKHKIPMHSLDKRNTHQEMIEWCNKYLIKKSYCVQEKLDGISVSVEYQDGRLVQMLTRGGGDEGEDITRNAIKMKGVPTQLPTDFTGFLRGEVMMLKSDWEEYNKIAEENDWSIAKNPRNGASGIARRLSGEGSEYLTAMFYTIVGEEFDTYSEMMNYISKVLSLEAPNFKTCNLQELRDWYDEYEASIRDSLDYEIDGMVIKIDSITQSNNIDKDVKEGKKPKSQMAWKFESSGASTTLIGVDADLGVVGNLTPVGIVEPVEVGGVTISRVSLHNWPMIKEMNLKIGSKVRLIRANDVIPKVVGVISDGHTEIIPPTNCPKCGEGLVENGKFISCENTDCEGLLAGKIQKWITKMGVDNFGPSIINQLVEAGTVSSVADLYKLQEFDIAVLDRQGDRSAEKALTNLHAKKQTTLANLIGALNIKSFGTSLATVIVENGFDTLDKVFKMKPEDLIKIDGFEEKRATDICYGIQKNKELLKELSNIMTIGSTASKTAGPKICITGKLSRPKKYYQNLLESNGYQYARSVSKDLAYLVADNPAGSSSKIKKAKRYKIPIISETELESMIG